MKRITEWERPANWAMEHECFDDLEWHHKEFILRLCHSWEGPITEKQGLYLMGLMEKLTRATAALGEARS